MFGTVPNTASGSSSSPLRACFAASSSAQLLRPSTLLRLLLRGVPDHDDRPVRAGHRAPHEQQVAAGVDPDHPERLHGPRARAHVAGHPLTLEYARRVRGADRPRLAHVHRPVRLGAAAEVVPAHHALEPLALARALDVDQLALGEDVRLQLLAHRDALEAPELRDVAVRLQAGRLELAADRRRGLAPAHLVERQAGRVVAVPVLGPQAEHAAGPRLQHGHRGHGAVGVEHLRHAHLAGEQPLLLPPRATHSLISIATPAGRLSRISESTTRGFGSRMSMMRLWVRISNCSRESLSMNGERLPVILLISVGSGMGPAVRALVRRAVSTILSAAWSRTLWS